MNLTDLSHFVKFKLEKVGGKVMTTEKQVTDKIKEVFGEEFQGMTINKTTMIVGIGEKNIVIEDYPQKTPEEIIEELNKEE